MNLNNINTIARYEVKLLKRSWLFRIFAVLALLGITSLLLIDQTAILNRFQVLWPKIAVASFMPFASTLLYNIAQSVIVIFLAGSFLKRDKKLDTAEVIYVRPMSNADYIIGKTWGILRVFVSLNIIALVITAFFNILINKSPFSLFPYVFYLLTVSVPSLLFVLGLSFTAMCLLKNQAVTFIVMLGIIGTVFFYLAEKLYGVFDFFGTTIPSVFSEVTGHGDIRMFLLQRFIYLIAGIGLISFTIALVKRLPHKPWKTTIVKFIGSGCILIGCIGGLLYVLHYQHQQSLRSEYIASFSKYSQIPKVDIQANDITITPKGNYLEAESSLKVTNTHADALDKLIFYLNPSLEVSSIEVKGNSMPFTRENQIIIINTPLQSGEELALKIHYRGQIDENICYTDILEKDYFNTENSQKRLFRIGKRYAWLENNFTLLTPECFWYPVSAPPVNPDAPYDIQKNFTNYTLSVISEKDQTVLSQGESKKEGNTTTFTNRFPLPGISLTIADYDKKVIHVDSIEYAIYYFKGHDYFSPYFTLIQDTLPNVIRELKNDIELSKGRDYPFSKFVLAETPVQFASYLRNWKGYTEYIQPEIVFIPERGSALDVDFTAEKRRNKEWRRHDQGMPDETELAINSFRSFIQSTFTDEDIQSGWNNNNTVLNKFNISPMFFGFTGFVRSGEYPIIDIVLNTMQNSPQDQSFRMSIINDKQRANLYLESNSFKTAIGDTSLKPEIFFELLKLKSTELNNYITCKIDNESFNNFLKDFYAQRQYRAIPFDTLKQEIQERFALDLTDFMHNWYVTDHSPTLFIRDVDANEVIIDEFTKYQVKFKINNPSDVDAIISSIMWQGRSGGGRRGGGSFSLSTPQNFLIPAKTAQEIKIICDDQPNSLIINTNISHNLPTSHSFNFSKIDNTTNDTTEGGFPISPDMFKPNPNEIIVDNEDSGFRTIASNSRHKLKDIFQKEDNEKYKNFTPWWMPSQWTNIAADYCYGETINSAVYKNKGSGANAVEWKADIQREGYYEVSIWNPKSRMGFRMGRQRGNRGKSERNQTYTLQSEQEKESITLDLEQEGEGWISIGNFFLPKGFVTITLTDKVSGDYVIADAVKFTFTD